MKLNGIKITFANDGQPTAHELNTFHERLVKLQKEFTFVKEWDLIQ